MKTVVILCVLLCAAAAFAAPAEENKSSNKELPPDVAGEEKQADPAPETEVKTEVKTEDKTEDETENKTEDKTVKNTAVVVEDSGSAQKAYFNYCPEGWFGHGSHCYMFVKSLKTWFDAEKHCSDLGSRLASASSARDYSFLQQLTQTAGQTQAWLGGFKLSSTWLWIDSERFSYTNWATQSSSSSYLCVYLQSAAGWTNYPCTYSKYFICSKNAFGCENGY
ncbi:uncharacterized protein V6R79_010180 [Siganus canaliculatus]